MRICYHCMQQISNEKEDTCPKCGQRLKAVRKAERFLEPGTVLGGKFLAGDPLGAGGFGNTYIGWDNLLFRKVAIKEFYPEQYCIRGQDGKTVTVTDVKMRARFIRGRQEFLEEARRVAALHEVQGVVEISNFFEENGTGYIVMEYLEGMDIRTILKKSGDKKDYAWSRRVILSVLYTLNEVHKRGVIHRDIAPDNIFVTEEGIIKLIDFGAAKYASAENAAEITLKTGYAPIEQYSRMAKQGSYTDLYAAAALFYRMLTGQKPIPANERVKQDGLIPPSQMGVILPEQAELAIMVCLNVMPKYRLQSAVDFMEALDGKNFIPVYEPEWILPPAEEKKGLWEKITMFPAMAKAALCFACISMMGLAAFGASTIMHNAKAAANLADADRDGMLTMEDYSGQSYEEAVAKLEQKGFVNIAAPEYVLDSRQEGEILQQNIKPSDSVLKEDEIFFTVSGGDRYYTMPDFMGEKEEDVIRSFTEKNFDVQVYKNPCDKEREVHTETGENESLAKKKGKIIVKRCFSENYRAGICFDQSIEPEETCEVDTIIILSVSVGGELKDFDVAVPDLIDATLEEAEERLKASGLEKIVKLELYYEEEDRERESDAVYVAKQSIEAGKTVNRYQDQGISFRLGLKTAHQKSQKKG